MSNTLLEQWRNIAYDESADRASEILGNLFPD